MPRASDTAHDITIIQIDEAKLFVSTPTPSYESLLLTLGSQPEMVTITAKDKDEITNFSIHLGVLKLHSLYFRRLFDGPWSEAQAETKRASLEFPPDAVKLLSRWLYGLDIAPQLDAEEIPWLPLVRVWSLADFCPIPTLQDHAMEIMMAKLDLQDVVGLEEAVSAVWEMQPEACPLREVFTDNLLLLEAPLRFDRLPDGFFREAYPKAHRKLDAVRYGASLLKRWVSRFQPHSAEKLKTDVLPRLEGAPLDLEKYLVGEELPSKK